MHMYCIFNCFTGSKVSWYLETSDNVDKVLSCQWIWHKRPERIRKTLLKRQGHYSLIFPYGSLVTHGGIRTRLSQRKYPHWVLSSNRRLSMIRNKVTFYFSTVSKLQELIHVQQCRVLFVYLVMCIHRAWL